MKTRHFLIFLILTGLAFPFVFTLAGDAQVHLAIAENFANGRSFQYNPGGELVVASTSPFWTLLLTLFYLLVGRLTPLLLKLVVVAIWLGSAALLYRLAQKQLKGVAIFTIVGLWLGHTTVVANALSGLENVLSAWQLLWLVYLLARWQTVLTWQRSVGLGLLLGWMVLTRPDGGLFGLLTVGLYGLWLLPTLKWPQVVGKLALTGLVAGLVLAPWYAYQWNVTGQLVTDSSLARLYNGRLGSLSLIPPWLYAHPKPLVALASAFLPLCGGYVVMLARPRRLVSDFVWLTAVVLVLAGFGFYTFVVGGEAFGRYFLPLYPFLFLTGIAGLQTLIAFVSGKAIWLGWTTAVLAILFLVGSSGLDYYRRLVPGRFTVQQPLDVIYGPAHQQYFSFNLLSLVSAPAQRPLATSALWRQLAAVENKTITLAITEVQLRYFVDERVQILSLDGRTSATILAYTDPITGVPDFARYFQSAQPDFVHVNQWCKVGGFLATIFTSAIQDNLVCRWEKQTSQMKLGEAFTWQGHRVTLVAPEIVQIDWLR